MSEPPKLLQQALARIGLSIDSVQQINFGGVVGKLALVAGATVLALGTGLWTLENESVVTLLIVAIFIVAMTAIVFVFIFAIKHPMIATLDGAQVTTFQKQQLMGAKDFLAPPDDQLRIGQVLSTEPLVAEPEREVEED